MTNDDAQSRYKHCMHMLVKCNRLHHAKIEQQVSDLGLHRSQHSALLTINFNGNICQKDLAQRMEVSPAAMTVTLKKLEAQGFIKRIQSIEDSRVNRITMTQKGKEIIDKSAAIFHQVDEQTFKGFSEEDIENLVGYLDRIARNLKDASQDRCEND